MSALEESVNLDPFDPGDEQEPPPSLDGPVVEALDQAGWHLRQIARLEAQHAEQAELYRRERDRLDERWRERERILNDQIEWHRAPLVQLHARILADDPKRKTIELPHGTLKATVPKTPRVFIPEPEALAVWANIEWPELLPPKDRVPVTLLRKLCDVREVDDGWVAVRPDTGEVVPHVQVEIPEPSFTVSTEGEVWP